MPSGPTPSVSECRIRARRLLKQLRSDKPDEAATAATRFHRLRSYADRPLAELLARRERVQLKHALTVIAVEGGYESWTALKAAAEVASRKAPPPGREMYEPGLDVLLNRWFPRYEEARASLEELGGYLFPYDPHFYVTAPEGIRILGLDPDDPDWARIGFDWVRPADPEAFERLRRKRFHVMGLA